MAEKPKRGRGRPRVHKEDSTKIVSFRVPLEVAAVIGNAIATIKVAGQQTHSPSPVIILDALKARLKQLNNRLPDQASRAVARIDKAMQHYEYLEDR